MNERAVGAKLLTVTGTEAEWPLFVTVTLGASVAVLGAIDGVAEATANFAKLASGRMSDRSRRRKPLILAGYGLAALSKPLFPIAGGPAELMADSAQMNMWLHKTVLAQIAANGGNGGVTTHIAGGKVTVPAFTWKVALVR